MIAELESSSFADRKEAHKAFERLVRSVEREDRSFSEEANQIKKKNLVQNIEIGDNRSGSTGSGGSCSSRNNNNHNHNNNNNKGSSSRKWISAVFMRRQKSYKLNQNDQAKLESLEQPQSWRKMKEKQTAGGKMQITTSQQAVRHSEELNDDRCNERDTEDDTQEDEQDSYELELDAWVKRERETISPMMSNSRPNLALISRSKSTTIINPAREKSQLLVGTPADERPSSAFERPLVKQMIQIPIIERFISSHQISRESYLADESADSASESSSSRELRDRQSVKLEDYNHCNNYSNNNIGENLCSLHEASATSPGKVYPLSERDLRLLNWRLLVRSMSSSSLASSDSELDLLDCMRPAPAVDCSDSTSCSSVELIWYPESSECLDLRTGSGQAPRRQEYGWQLFEATITSPQKRSPMGRAIPAMNGPKNYSPGRVKRNSPQRATSVGQVLPVMIEPIGLSPVRVQQRASKISVLELAKPSRARRKQRRHRKSEPERGSSETPEISTDWVANPLFSREEMSSSLSLDDDPCLVVEVSSSVESPNDPTDDMSESNSPPVASKKLSKIRKMFKTSTSGGQRSAELYLTQIRKLDERIKKLRNSSSQLTSQLSLKLSDTGKRASLLADQLVASIKDTTKEQLLTPGGSFRRALSGQRLIDSSSEQTRGQQSGSGPKKEQMFSLIYMHQQQTGNGRPVITRQPGSSSRLSASLISSDDVGWPSENDQEAVPSIIRPPPLPIQSPEELKSTPGTQLASSNTRESLSANKREVDSPLSQPNRGEGSKIDTDKLRLDGKAHQILRDRKRRLIKRRHKSTVVQTSDDSDDSDTGSSHFGLSKTPTSDSNSVYPKKFATSPRVRSLAYWRGYRSRSLASNNWQLVFADETSSLDIMRLDGKSHPRHR